MQCVHCLSRLVSQGLIAAAENALLIPAAVLAGLHARQEPQTHSLLSS